MMDLIGKLGQILNACKNFTVAYGTRAAERNQMLVKYKDKAYIVKFYEVGLPEITDKLRKKYNGCTNDEIIQLSEVLKYL